MNKLLYDIIIEDLNKSEELILDFIVESSNVTMQRNADVDDGPRYFFGNLRSYKKKSNYQAERIGYKVIDYILGKDEKEFEIHNTEFPNGPTGTVSYFDSGIPGEEHAGTNYLDFLDKNDAYNAWLERIRNIATMTGFKFIDFYKQKYLKNILK